MTRNDFPNTIVLGGMPEDVTDCGSNDSGRKVVFTLVNPTKGKGDRYDVLAKVTMYGRLADDCCPLPDRVLVQGRLATDRCGEAFVIAHTIHTLE